MMNKQSVFGEHRSRTARIAGLLYLIVVVTGMFSLGYVPSRIHVSGDPASAMANVQTASTLFRLGIGAGMVCYVAFLLLPLSLHRLLAPVGKNAAALMLAFGMVGATLSLANLANRLHALPLLDAASGVHALGVERLQAEFALSLSAYGSGLLIPKLFWGLWLLPLGFLVFKSKFLPSVLGLLLMAGCAGYLVDVFGTLLLPGYRETAISNYATLPAAIGEIGTCLWLLVFGVRSPKPRAESFPATGPGVS